MRAGPRQWHRDRCPVPEGQEQEEAARRGLSPGFHERVSALRRLAPAKRNQPDKSCTMAEDTGILSACRFTSLKLRRCVDCIEQSWHDGTTPLLTSVPVGRPARIAG